MPKGAAAKKSAHEIHEFWSSKDVMSQLKKNFAKKPDELRKATLLHKVACQTDDKTFHGFVSGKMEDLVIKLSAQEMNSLRGGWGCLDPIKCSILPEDPDGKGYWMIEDPIGRGGEGGGGWDTM